MVIVHRAGCSLGEVDERAGLADKGEFEGQQHLVLAAHMVARPAVGELASHLLGLVPVDAVDEFGQFADGQLPGTEGGGTGLGSAGDGVGESITAITKKRAVDVVGILLLVGHGPRIGRRPQVDPAASCGPIWANDVEALHATRDVSPGVGAE
ncbi:hypothetical protein G6038_21420 [Rhodococcus sp. 14C212]|uniref:hypothetical protein n=1 Tax=Rhodococcus sp. 14C212 TaxID=2711209 RepID=UPI0013ECE2D1|nr:hypothetical protein [Rhodococcus sp. 14C212]NGP07986.1 hypothetical protein [Rhodococcus sp. 14C212]